MDVTGTAVLVLGPSGMATARRLAAALPGAEIHGRRGAVEGADVSFDDTASHLRHLFRSGVAVVGVCAAGILVRCLAPVLGDKRAEPPVLAVAEDGSAVVPLLGGHHGANELARTVAGELGVIAAITTAGDVRFAVALDEPPVGWRLANPGDVKAFSARLLAGAKVRLEGDAAWLRNSRLPFADDGELVIAVTDGERAGNETTLVYHPAVLALGIGCERGASAREALDLVHETLGDAGLSPMAVAAVVSLDLKADEAAVHAVADGLGVPARFFDAAALEAQTPRLANPSDLVFAEVGCHGVAEGAALVAAGTGGELIVPKRKSRRVTCAVVRASQSVDVTLVGRPRGHLAVVGIGPGKDGWRTPEANALVAAADDLVAYGLYTDLLGPAAAGKRRHDFALGEEEARVRTALDLAAEGRRVALICSGDAGIYAMAALVFELLDREAGAGWSRVEVVVTPGISALQAAAARAGAPLGHDFCAISLSDLLTPWAAIERRVRAAAEGDFVIAFYNPVSRRRRTQLAAARDILLTRRPADTPVVLARNLGRTGETLDVVRLADLDVEAVDMLTLVLVGSSETRAVRRGDGGTWIYTPRGYGARADGEAAVKRA